MKAQSILKNSRSSLAVIALVASLHLLIACGSNTNTHSVPQSSALVGGESSGGGNGIQRLSTIEDVQNALDSLLSSESLAGTWVLGEDWALAKSPTHRSVLKSLSEKYYSQIQELKRTDRIDLKMQGACLDPFGGSAMHDGSVTSLNVSSRICLSADRLRRFAPGELRAQIDALLVHEVAHQLGFGEALATYAQTKRLNDLKSNVGKKRALSSDRRYIWSVASGLAKPMRTADFAKVIKTRDLFRALAIACTGNSSIDVETKQEVVKNFCANQGWECESEYRFSEGTNFSMRGASDTEDLNLKSQLVNLVSGIERRAGPNEITACDSDREGRIQQRNDLAVEFATKVRSLLEFE